MTRAERWLSRVLPPRAVWLTAVAIVVAAFGVGQVYEYVDATLDVQFVKGDPYAPFYGAMGLALVAYGVWRATFYPANDDGYADWLATTPWTSAKRLPNGPALLAWQDAIVVGPAAAACLLPGRADSFWVALIVPLGFVVPYLFGLNAGNWSVRQDASVVVSLFALASVPLAIGRPGMLALAWLLAIVAYAATAWGVSRGLRAFPWSGSRRKGFNEWLQEASQPAIIPPLVHWQDVTKTSPLSWRCVAACAGLTGWTVFAVTDFVERVKPHQDDRQGVLLFAITFAMMLALVRWITYCGRHTSPISLWGRIATGRLIIPGYDRVYIGPAAILLTAAVVPWGLRALEVPTPVVAGLTIAAIVFVALGCGPSLREWHLTGEHRLALSRPRARRARAELRGGA